MNIAYSKEGRHVKCGERLFKMPLNEALELCKNLPENAEKGTQGAIFPFANEILLSKESDKFQSDGVIFIDIDKCSDYSDRIMEHFDEFAAKMHCLVAMTKSYSGNLHIFTFSQEVKDDFRKYNEIATLHLAVIAHLINRKLGIDLRKIEKALDTHNTNITQRLYLNYSDYHYSDSVDNMFIDDNYFDFLKGEYEELFNKSQKSKTSVINYNLTYSHANCSNLEVNMTDKSKFHYNYEEKYRIANTLAACDMNADDIYRILSTICKNVKDKQCEFDKELRAISKTSLSKKTPTKWAIKELKDRWGIDLKLDIESYDLNQFQNDIEINYLPKYDSECELSELQYLSDVEMEDILKKNKNILIVAPCGCGKTEWVKTMAKLKVCDIIEPMKSTIGGKFNDCDIQYIEKPNQHIGQISQLMIYDTFCRTAVCKDTTFIDESHLLIEHDEFRDAPYEVLKKMIGNERQVIMMTGSPMGEQELLNDTYCCKITKKNDHKQKAIFHFTRDCYSTAKQLLKDAKNRGVVSLIPSNKQNKRNAQLLDEIGLKYDEYKLSHKGSEAMENINKENKIGDIDALSVTSYLNVGNEIKEPNKNIETFVLNWNLEQFTAQSMYQFASRVRNSDITIHIVVKMTPYLFSVNSLTKSDVDTDLLENDVKNGGSLSKHLRAKFKWIDENGNINFQQKDYNDMTEELLSYWKQFPVICTMFRKLGFETEFVEDKQAIKSNTKVSNQDKIDIMRFIVDEVGIDDFINEWISHSTNDSIRYGKNAIEEEMLYIQDTNFTNKVVNMINQLKRLNIATKNIEQLIKACENDKGILNMSKMERAVIYFDGLKSFDDDIRQIRELCKGKKQLGKNLIAKMSKEFTKAKVEQSFRQIGKIPTEKQLQDEIDLRLKFYATVVRSVLENDSKSNQFTESTNPNINIVFTDEFLSAIDEDKRKKQVTLTNGTDTKTYDSMKSFCKDNGYNQNTVKVSFSRYGCYNGWSKVS